MAFSSKVIKQDVQGSMIVQIIEADLAGVTTGHIKTGLRTIFYAHFNNEVTENDGKVVKNSNAAGNAAEDGSVLLSGFTSNDKATLIVYGY